MTKQEYIKKINSISHRLSDDNVEASAKELDGLFEYKPVSLKWYIARAEVMLRAGEEPDTVLDFLESRGWYGYNYPGLEELSELYVKICLAKGDELDARRNKFAPWICFGEPYQRYASEIEAEYKLLREREIAFCEDVNSDEKALALMDSYFVVGNAVGWCLVSFWLKKRGVPYTERKRFYERTNFGWLEERAISDNEETFIIVVTDGNDALECDTASVLLTLLGNKVYLIDIPVDCPVERRMDMRQTLEVSLDNISDNNGITIIPAVCATLGGKPVGDNRAELIDHIVNNCTENKFATTLSSGALTDDLRERPVLRTQMHRLDEFTTPGEEKYLSFSRTGSYITYLGMLYDFDVQAAIDSEPQCDYSIVVPARNSASTLRYTLMTCLEQRYKGSYEIVLSDNSTNGNTAVYDLYKELDDPRIKYYKTPHELPLTKSFEYALLHAKGGFIFSLGSDDGILPWGLERIDEALKQFPDEDVLSWDRAFYAWPGFNGGQQHQFTVTVCQKDEKQVSRQESSELLNAITRNRNVVYLLPMMYINSGFKRTYFKKLLDKTGCILDGSNQDVYLGTITACLFKNILHLCQPVTMAGMSGNSINSANDPAHQMNYYGSSVSISPSKVYMRGEFSFTASERLIPSFGSDLQVFYSNLFRAKAFGLLTLSQIEKMINNNELFDQILGDVQIDDDYFDNKIHFCRYTASKISKELCGRIDRYIESNSQPKKVTVDTSQLTRKLYTEGFSGGGLTLDASRFGVTNIYEAVRLAENILNL